MLRKNKEDLKDYEIARIEGRDVYYHELVYVLMTGLPIPDNTLIGHIDGDTMNNKITNLFPFPAYENDYHIEKNKIFHENNIGNNIYFIKKHFPEVYKALDLEHYNGPEHFDEKKKIKQKNDNLSPMKKEELLKVIK